MKDQNEKNVTLEAMDIHGIMACLPHRYPFLLVDKLIDFVPFESGTGIKNVTINEPFFQGHFPGRPVMPGVMLIEAMAQTAAVIVLYSLGLQEQNNLVYFLGIENAKFRKIISPGDQIHIKAQKQKQRSNVWRFSFEAKVDEVLVADAILTAMLVPQDKQ